MRLVLEKLLPNEDGSREQATARSFDELVDMFPEIYESIVDSKAIRDGILFEAKKYPEELQDYLVELLYSSNVKGFRANPAYHWNLRMLSTNPNVEKIPHDDVWMMIDVVL